MKAKLEKLDVLINDVANGLEWEFDHWMDDIEAFRQIVNSIELKMETIKTELVGVTDKDIDKWIEGEEK